MAGKTQISFYGGISSIGGNKILLTSANKNSILLDFGLNFTIKKNYFNEFMDIRKNESLVDACMIGEIPLPVGNLKGIYLKDYFKENKCDPAAGDNRLNAIIEEKLEQYETNETKYQIFHNFKKSNPKVTEILLSHSHSDHVSDISYIDPKIKIVCSKNSKKILDLLEETSVNSLFSGITQFKTLFYSENGERKRGAPVITRKFIEMRSGDKIQCGNGDFDVKFLLTDHSIPGAGAFLIKDNTTEIKIIYTGDFRDHGPNGKRTNEFIQEAKNFHPDLIITEGTRIEDPKDDNHFREDDLGTEKNVKKEIQRIVDNAKENKLILIQSSNRDLWRFSSITKALGKKRYLVVDAKTYYFIREMDPNSFEIDLSKIKAYLPRKGWGVYDNRDYSYSPDIFALFQNSEESEKKPTNGKRKAKHERINLNQNFAIRSDEINQNPGKYMFHINAYTMNQLFDIQPPPGSYFILSRSGPFDDEGEIEEQQRKNWLELFDIPESNQFQCHCSGHMQPDHLYSMLSEINPKFIFPVHTEHPEIIKEKMGDRVIIPKFGKIYEF